MKFTDYLKKTSKKQDKVFTPPIAVPNKINLIMTFVLPEEIENSILFDYLNNNCLNNPEASALSCVSKKWNAIMKNRCSYCFKYTNFGKPLCMLHDKELLNSCIDIIVKMIITETSIIYLHGSSLTNVFKAIEFLEENIGLNLKICHFCCDGFGVCIRNKKIDSSLHDFAWYLL